VGKPDEETLLGRHRHSVEHNIKMDCQEVESEQGLDRSGSGYRRKVGCCECGNKPSGSIKCGEFFG
jgi:hypothetical protein